MCKGSAEGAPITEALKALLPRCWNLGTDVSKNKSSVISLTVVFITFDTFYTVFYLVWCWNKHNFVFTKYVFFCVWDIFCCVNFWLLGLIHQRVVHWILCRVDWVGCVSNTSASVVPCLSVFVFNERVRLWSVCIFACWLIRSTRTKNGG